VWTVTRDAAGAALVARNPTPFFISVIGADVCAGALHDQARTAMLSPRSSARFALSGADLKRAATVHYSFVNDFGAVVNGDANAEPAP